jgi:DNA repair protein RecO (recombination protein O)
MPLIRDQAVVLARLDYSETSQVIVLFTREHGKVRAIAKGIKRGTKQRFAAGIDLLDIGSVNLSARQERQASLATVTEWRQTRSLSGLREKLHRIQAGQYLAEITAALTEDWDPHERLFDSLLSALSVLADAPEPLEQTTGYQRVLLTEIGSWPRFDACVLCGRTEQLTHFSSFEGGAVCRHCEPVQVEKREVGLKTLAWLANGRPCPSWAPPFELLDYHIAHLMGREPKVSASLLPKSKRGRVV